MVAELSPKENHLDLKPVEVHGPYRTLGIGGIDLSHERLRVSSNRLGFELTLGQDNRDRA